MVLRVVFGFDTALVRSFLIVALIVLPGSTSVGDERPPRSGAANDDGDFPAFDLPQLLPGSGSPESTLPPIDDTDRGVIPRRSRDTLRLDPTPQLTPPRGDTRERDSGFSSSPDYLPPVGDDRRPSRDDRSLPLRDPFAPAQPRRPSETPDPALPAENGSVATDGFDWRLQPVTLADLKVGHPWSFEHTKPNLSAAEMEDYISLIRAAKDRKNSVGLYLPDDVNIVSAWESAFYRFAEARRQAWSNGNLRLQPTRSGLANPFDSIDSAVVSAADRIETPDNLKSYSLTADMRSHPSEFVGRPVVLYGLFTPSVINQLQATRSTGDEKKVYKLQRGFLRNLSNTENIALVDAEGFVDYDSQKKAIEAWPVDQRISYPVLVKGWFVKTMGGQPLVYCDVVRVLTPRPYDESIRDHVHNRRRISDDESWLYYETLRQLQITSSEIQAGIALADQQLRVNTLMAEVREKAIADRALIQNAFKKGSLGDLDGQNKGSYQAKVTRLERQIDQRLNRYREFQQHPDTFPMFVDIFQYPDRWQGHLVTLRGHVRRVTSHVGDPGLFNGQPLYELWLFTDDSQHNPTVIVTPSLPDEFPRNAAVVDSVTVTGCLFKMYVYKSQTENRIAPLLLAGRINWQPTNDQIVALGKEGHFAKGSPLLAVAKANSGNPVSDTMVLLFGFVSLLATMTIWGRVQRDRRESERLKLLVDERPDFRQTSQDMYSGPFAESRYEPTRR